MNLSFKSSTDGSNRPTALFVGGGTVEIDSCIFEDKLLQKVYIRNRVVLLKMRPCWFITVLLMYMIRIC